MIKKVYDEIFNLQIKVFPLPIALKKQVTWRNLAHLLTFELYLFVGIDCCFLYFPTSTKPQSHDRKQGRQPTSKCGINMINTPSISIFFNNLRNDTTWSLFLCCLRFLIKDFKMYQLITYYRLHNSVSS